MAIPGLKEEDLKRFSSLRPMPASFGQAVPPPAPNPTAPTTPKPQPLGGQTTPTQAPAKPVNSAWASLVPPTTASAFKSPLPTTPPIPSPTPKVMTPQPVLTQGVAPTPPTAKIPSPPPIAPVTQPAATPKTITPQPIFTQGEVKQPTPETPKVETPKAEAPVEPPAPTISPVEDSLTEWEDMARQWAGGEFDTGLTNAVNKVFTSLGLANQAERDAMQMRINQDPALAGQGAGNAMLQIMSRNQNFNTDQMFASLATDHKKLVLDMQKYGFEQGIKINETRRIRDLDNFNTLFQTGEFEGAAASLQKVIDRDFPGSGITVNSDTFKSRDAMTRGDEDRDFNTSVDQIAATSRVNPESAIQMAQALIDANPNRFAPGMTAEQYVANLEEDAKRDEFSVSQFSSKMDRVREIATVDPNAAAAMLQTIMDDPSYKGWFPEGSTAQQLLESYEAARLPENLQASQNLQSEINTLAASDTASFDEAAAIYDDLFRLTGRDAISEGKKLSIDDVNDLRSIDGMSDYSLDAQGNMVDENGIPLSDEDFEELAYRKDYEDRRKKAEEQPWMDVYNAILNTPEGAQFTNEEYFPGGKDALKNYVASMYLSGMSYIQDPQTGEMVPDMSSASYPWEDPAMYPMFYTWPKAVFGADGTVQVDANGNQIFDGGGDVYGESLGGEEIRATPEDEQLDEAYFKYRRTGGDLTAPEWYFATAGGSLAADTTRVPESVANAASTVNGLPGDGGAEPMDLEDIISKVRTGGTKDLSEDDIKALVGSGVVETYTFDTLASAGNSNTEAKALANNAAGGLVLIDGNPVKVLPEGGNYEHHSYMSGLSTQWRRYGWVMVEVGGTKYKLDSQGNWYPGDADLNTKKSGGKLPATVSSPFEAKNG